MRIVPRETITLVWSSDWDSPLATRERYAFEHDVLPHFLMERRWFAEKARGLPGAKIETAIPLERHGVSATLAVVGVPGERSASRQQTRPAICFR